VEALQARLKDLDAAIDSARRDQREAMRAKRNAVQAELNLATQVRDTVRALAQFSPNSGSGGLAVQIEELERSIPEAVHRKGGEGPVAASTSGAAVAAPFHPESTGIIGLGTQLFTLSHNRGQVRDLMEGTARLTKSLNELRAPLLNEVRAVVRRSEELGSGSTESDADALEQNRRQIDDMTARFKQLSAVLVPLGEQGIVLATVRGNLTEAMTSIGSQYEDAGRFLLLRLGVLGAAIGAVMLLSGVWRRVTFRYVRDPRRRTQFLTLRRVVMACAIFVTILLSFITEFGSLATYAGLLTAGIAVALQNVILSVVGYFFLIGRYGVRTGDRVTIAGVTGNVIDIGLVRIYMAELAGSNGEMRPTGRIVVYSNSILFQPSALFKQLSGTDYIWHTVRLTLTPDSDARLAELRLTEAANAVYERHRKTGARATGEFEDAVHAQIGEPKPEVRVHASDEGIEVTVRYPAEMKHAAITDAELMQALRETVRREPRLEVADAGAPVLVADAK
jgi:small-conductance mechanosensitive channel